MIYITLVCNAGMSTSMLTSRMVKYAKKADLEVDIIAMSDGAFKSTNDRKTDILLLGPQVIYLYNEFERAYGAKMKVKVIDAADYGMMNGEKVLKDALALLD